MPLSQNVELLRRDLELFEREGPAAVSALSALADPDIEVHAAPGIEPEGTYRGLENAMRWAQEWFEVWGEFRMEPTKFIEVGDRFVAVSLRSSATGKASGVEVESEIAFLFEFGMDG